MRRRPKIAPEHTTSGLTRRGTVPSVERRAPLPVPIPAGTPAGVPGVYLAPPPDVRRESFTLPRKPPAPRKATPRPRYLVGRVAPHALIPPGDPTSTP